MLTIPKSSLIPENWQGCKFLAFHPVGWAVHKNQVSGGWRGSLKLVIFHKTVRFTS
jgi:hypothetical protein